MNELTTAEAEKLGTEAFVFGFPLVVMDMTRRKLTNVEHPAGLAAPVNQFVHAAEFPDAEFEDVVSPNADTLYSSGWLDLTDEPVLLHVPDTKGRYYLMPMLDLWSNVFASPGARTTGTAAGDYAICGPHFDGELPNGVERIDAPTSLVWIIGRTQANGREDFEFVHGLQAGYTLTPLSQLDNGAAPSASAVDPDFDMVTAPVDMVTALDAAGFLSRLAALMVANPPAAEDAPALAELARLGLEPGKFDGDALDGPTKAAVEAGFEVAKKQLVQAPDSELENGWRVIRSGIGTYGTDYGRRAFVALIGLGANLPEDAIYPMTTVDADGEQLSGAHDYVLRFEPGKLPPVEAFWSLTMYDMRQFFVDNRLDRYAIGDRDALRLNGDGSLEIQISREAPAEGDANWLPAPEADFNVMLRMYWPKQPMLDGSWTLPAVTRVS